MSKSFLFVAYWRCKLCNCGGLRTLLVCASFCWPQHLTRAAATRLGRNSVIWRSFVPHTHKHRDSQRHAQTRRAAERGHCLPCHLATQKRADATQKVTIFSPNIAVKSKFIWHCIRFWQFAWPEGRERKWRVTKKYNSR